MSSDQQYGSLVGTRVTEDVGEELQQLAHERSEPGDRTTVSEVVREAIDEYLERHSETDD